MLYRHQDSGGQVLVPPYVAAGITDLLQTAVSTGTGRAAQIGRPVAGKTGTTSSNKDGWFLGFSSGITTGVWMGRDNAAAVAGLQGGTAPARAFAAFMRYAVARRPVEKFDTDLKLPEWQLEPDDEAYYANPDEALYIDEQGRPLDPDRPIENPLPMRDGEDDLAPVELPSPTPSAAASDDFLGQATGRSPAAEGTPRPRPGLVPQQLRPASVNPGAARPQ